VQNGGTLIADHSTGLYDETLRRRDAGALDRLLGIERRSLSWNDLLVREGRSTARSSAADAGGLLPAELGLRGELGRQERDTDTFLERPHGSGRGYYLNAPVVAYSAWRLDERRVAPARELRRRVRTALERAGVHAPCDVRGEGLPTCIERVPLRLRDGRRVLAIRVNALERPDLLARLAKDGPVPIEILWPGPRRLARLGGDELGEVTSLETRLDPFGALLFEVGR
jgi:hypothetical protein